MENNQYQMPVIKKQNEWAIVSLIGGIAGLTILPLIGSLFGVIGGNLAKKQIMQNPETQTGEDLAKWGSILGWIGIGLSVVALCVIILAFGVLGSLFRSAVSFAF